MSSERQEKPQTFVDALLEETRELDQFVLTSRTLVVDGHFVFMHPVSGRISWSRDRDANLKNNSTFIRAGDSRETEDMKKVRRAIESSEVFKQTFSS